MTLTSTAFLLYLYTIAVNISVISSVILFLVVGGGLIVSGVAMGEETPFEEILPHWRRALWIIIPLLVMAVGVPSKSDIKFIIGGSVALSVGEEFIGAKGIENLPSNIIDAANAFLEESKGETE